MYNTHRERQRTQRDSTHATTAHTHKEKKKGGMYRERKRKTTHTKKDNAHTQKKQYV